MKKMYEVRYEIQLHDWVGVEASSLDEAKQLVEDWVSKIDIHSLPKYVFQDANAKIDDWTESNHAIRDEFDAMTFVN
jgi:hypothetical protein